MYWFLPHANFYRRSRGIAALTLLVSGLLTMTAQAGDGLKKVQQRGSLIWGADQEGGGPFVFPAPDDPNRLDGFEVDLAKIIAESMGVKSQFQQGQWEKLPDLLDRGDIDIVLNGYEWTPPRADRYGISLPYYIYELQLLARKDDASLKSWDDLGKPVNGRKRRVSVLGGTAANDYIAQNFPNTVDIIRYDGTSDAMRAVELNLDGVDANLQDLPIWIFYKSGFPELTAVGPPVGRGYYVAMVRKNEPELLAAVNKALFEALQDGRLRKILAKYGLWNQTQMMRALELNPAGEFTGDITALQTEELESGVSEESFVAVRGWGVVWQRGWLLAQSAGMTVLLACTAMPLAILIGLLMAVLRRYGPWYLATPATMYVELVRGTPLVLQLYVIFFLLPEVGISVNAFWAAVFGLAMNYSAYEAEIYRAGLQAIPKGQMEAAQALGFGKWLSLRRIIIPQATKIVIPPMTNDFIALFKDTAVCSVITVVELSKQYYIQARSTGAIVELGLLTALLYLAMSYPLSLLAARLERRLRTERRK
ncbi:ABC transporter permease subunit [Planctomicrobium sp. SH668]|uniref:ABC transporter permease subunit n=1 Tax=Planctomicrobium sp. SH668 TaxID=3448126 RepID=UPI003F5BF5DF